MLELQLALEAKLSESSQGSTSPLARASSPSPQDGAARAAAGQLGIFSPAGVVCSAKGLAWTRGELEPPQGAERAASGLAAAVYTPEQQERLGVDEAGTAKGLLHTVASSPRTRVREQHAFYTARAEPPPHLDGGPLPHQRLEPFSYCDAVLTLQLEQSAAQRLVGQHVCYQPNT